MTSIFEDSEAVVKIKKETRSQTTRLFEAGDLLWMYRKSLTESGGSDPDEIRNLVYDTLWTANFNNWNDFSFREVEAYASTYLSKQGFQCTQLRNFYLWILVKHLRQLNLIDSRSYWWAAGWIAVFIAGVSLVSRSGTLYQIIGGLLIGIGAMASGYVIDLALRFLRAVRSDRLLHQVAEEVGRGAFDEQTTEERLKRLERRGIRVPSIVYALLRQPRLNVEDACAAEWAALPDWRKDQIYKEHIEWMRELAGNN